MHRFHSAVYSDLIHDHNFSSAFYFMISSFKILKQLNIVSLTSFVNLIESSSTISKFSHQSIAMIKAHTICSSSSSLISSQSFVFSQQKSHTLKIYMIVKDFLIKFAEKRFKKSKNNIHKRMCFSMFDQTFDYFKFVDQSNFTSIKSFKSFKFAVFINCFCSTSRFYFSVNRTEESNSNQQKIKTSAMQSFCTFQ